MIFQGAGNSAYSIITAILLGFFSLAAGAPGAPASRAPEPVSAGKPVLDTLRVRTLYLDGDFDPAIALLEGNLRAGGRYTHADSVFIFKHLGVMFAARSDAREKGKYYMHQLLAVEPTARIMDMYASDMIYMIFRNIQEEFEVSRRGVAALSPQQPAAGSGTRLEPPRPSPQPLPGPASQPATGDESARRKSRGAALVWIGAAGAVVGAGLAAYLILAEEPETRIVEHRVSGAVSR